MRFANFISLNVPLGLSLVFMKLLRSFYDDKTNAYSMTLNSVSESLVAMFFVRFFSQQSQKEFVLIQEPELGPVVSAHRTVPSSVSVGSPDLLLPLFKLPQIIVSISKKALGKSEDFHHRAYATSLIAVPWIRFFCAYLVEKHFSFSDNSSKLIGFCEKNNLIRHENYRECLDLNDVKFALWVFDIACPILLMSINRFTTGGHNCFLSSIETNSPQMLPKYKGRFLDSKNRCQLFSIFNGGVASIFYVFSRLVDVSLVDSESNHARIFFKHIGTRNLASLTYAFSTYFISKSLFPVNSLNFGLYKKDEQQPNRNEKFANVQFCDIDELKKLHFNVLMSAFLMYLGNALLDYYCFVDTMDIEFEPEKANFFQKSEHQIPLVFLLYWVTNCTVWGIDFAVRRKYYPDS